MSRRFQENLVNCLLLVLFAWVILSGQDYGPRARLAPTIVACLGIVFTLTELVLFNLRKDMTAHIDLLEVISARATGDDEALPDQLRNQMDAVLGTSGTADDRGGNRALRELGAVSVVLLAVLMFAVLGPMAMIFGFTFGYFIISGHSKPVRAALYSLTLAVSIYVVFVVWLRVHVDVGLITWDFGLW